MKHMGKWFRSAVLLLWAALFIHGAALSAHGAETDGPLDSALSDTVGEQLAASGAQDLPQLLSPEAQELLEALEMGHIDPGKLVALSPGDFVRVLWRALKDSVHRPVAALGTSIGVILLGALVGSLCPKGRSKALSSVFSTVSLLCIITIIVEPVTGCILDTASVLHDCSSFMLAFIPVFVSIVTVSGAPVTATTYQVLLFSACQAMSALASHVLVPFMGIYTGLCVAGSVGEDIGVLPLAKGIRSFVTWALTLSMTAYVGFMSMQTLVSSGADGAMLKTGKFLIGSFVPIVGSAISDALSAAQGAVHFLKTTVGAFGMVAGAVLFIPPIVRALLWYLMLKGASFTADVLSMGRLHSLFDACSNCLSTMLAILASFLLLILVSIVLLLSVSVSGSA